MTTKLGQSQSNEGRKDNERGQRENATWQAISKDGKTKTDEGKGQPVWRGNIKRATEGKMRKKRRQKSGKDPQSETVCMLTIFSSTIARLC